MRLLVLPYLWRPGSRSTRAGRAPRGRCACICCSRTCSGRPQTAAGGWDTRCSSPGRAPGSPDSWTHTAGSRAPGGLTPRTESRLESRLVLHPEVTYRASLRLTHTPGPQDPDQVDLMDQLSDQRNDFHTSLVRDIAISNALITLHRGLKAPEA